MIDPEVIARIAERKIQEAIEEGKFDNLPGKGKPIVFDDDPGVPLDVRMANKVLKNAGALPDWMMIQNDILTERQEAVKQRANLIRENERRQARLRTLRRDHPDVSRFAEWHALSRASYLRRLKSVNTSILKFSMMAPSTAPGYSPYRIEREMAEFDAAFPILEQAKDLPVKLPEPESKLKNLARTRYEQGGGELRGWARAARFLGFGNDSSPYQPDGGGVKGGTNDIDREDIKRAT